MVNTSKTVLCEKEWDEMFKKLREEAKESRNEFNESDSFSRIFGVGVIERRTNVKNKLELLEGDMKGLNKKLETGKISKEEYEVWKNRIYINEYKKLLSIYEGTFVY